MYALGVFIHVAVCFLMIAAILLQSGKGAEIGAAFGGSSQTVFGSRGPGTFLSKVTVAAAIIFMLTSLGLAVLSRERSTASTVIDLEQPVIPYTTDLPADTPSPGSSDETSEASPADTTPSPDPTSP
ncbi:preprotein translocase subunit SecG [Nitrospiraceae bacterium AH_259_D15_M11_P09]|nr:preprotein translocase subunit SecG [Nitrospiraceae bacterium AH_259_D15_M11_P09]